MGQPVAHFVRETYLLLHGGSYQSELKSTGVVRCGAEFGPAKVYFQSPAPYLTVGYSFPLGSAIATAPTGIPFTST